MYSGSCRWSHRGRPRRHADGGHQDPIASSATLSFRSVRACSRPPVPSRSSSYIETIAALYIVAQHHSLETPKYRNAAHCVYRIVTEEGLGTLYRGVGLTALRQATNQVRLRRFKDKSTKVRLVTHLILLSSLANRESTSLRTKYVRSLSHQRPCFFS
jgi:hypothetical protein